METQGTGLLRALQSGLADTLDTFCNGAEAIPYTKPANVDYVSLQASNMLDQIEQIAANSSKDISINLTDMNKIDINQDKEFITDFNGYKLAVINSQIWFTEENTKIQIHTQEGDSIKTITVDDAGHIRSFIGTHNVALVATSKGIFIINTQDYKSHRMATGNFVDLSELDETIYALDNNESILYVFEFKHETPMLRMAQTMEIHEYSKHRHNTLQVTMDFIYIAMWDPNTIQKYNHNCELITTHRDCIGPRLCGSDPLGHILVACNDKTLKIMSPNGDLIKVEGPFCDKYIWDATVAENKLFSRCGHISSNICVIYTLT